MKGIVLSGDASSCLYPTTRAVSKHLLPIYDKPMIYYPISVLMRCGVREALIISTPRDLSAHRLLLGSGKRIGMQFSYAVQDEPRGVAEALLIGAHFAKGERIALILGDCLFHGDFSLFPSLAARDDAVIFACPVKNPQAFGVVEMDENGRAVSIEEKPQNPRSRYAVPGLYFYPPDAPKFALTLAPSERGALEISDVNRIYLAQGRLHVHAPEHGVFWMAGTHEGLLEAAQAVAALQKQGVNVACLEEVALEAGAITADQFKRLAKAYAASSYGDYLRFRASKI